jgi:hypothetical protein
MRRTLKIVGIVVAALAAILVVAALLTPSPQAPLVTRESVTPPTTEPEAEAGLLPEQDVTILERTLTDHRGLPCVIGTVQNTSGRTLTDVKVCVKWYDTDGYVRGENCDFADCELAPREIFRFEVTNWDLEYREVGSYDITAQETWI